MTIWAIAVAIPALVWLGALLVRNARSFPPEVGPSTPWTGWRTSPFRVGKTYQVRESFKALRDSFTGGEVLVYRSQNWSRYDGVTGYFFTAPNDDKIRRWDLPDADDIATWKTLFEELPLPTIPNLPVQE